MVVLTPDPAFGGDVRRGKQLKQGAVGLRRVEVGQRGGVERGARRGGRFACGDRLVGRGVGQHPDGRRSDLGVAFHDAREAVGGDLADHGGVELPLLEPGGDIVDVGRLDRDDHALLRLGEHHFVGRHAALAARDALGVEDDPNSGALSHFNRGAGQAGCAAVLQALDPVAVLADEADARIHQQLFEERVADLDRGPALGA